MAEHPDAQVITALGGPVAVAAIFEIAPQAVSSWKKTGIPKARRMYLEVTRPEVFRPASEGAPAVPAEEARDAA